MLSGMKFLDFAMAHGIKKEDRSLIFDMILSTGKMNHLNADTSYLILLFNALELSIFMSDSKRYAQYVSLIRKEYSALTDDVFVKGRKSILAKLYVFFDYTKILTLLHEQGTQLAKDNITSELLLLENSAS